MSREPVRYALLIDDRPLQDWEWRVLDLLARDDLAVPVIVVRNLARARRPGIGRLFRHALYWVWRTLVRPRSWRPCANGRLIEACEEIVVTPRRDASGWSELPDEAIERLRRSRSDFILRFGFNLLKGSILGAAPYGVWSFHHGDIHEFRGRPAGLWEIAERRTVAGVTLQRLNSRLDGGDVLGQAFVRIMPWSWRATLDALYFGGTHLPRQACQRIASGQPLTCAEPASLGPLYGLPRNVTVVATFVRTVWAAVVRATYGLFVEKRWTVGIGRLIGSGQPWELGKIDWLDTKPGEIVADPCSHPRGYSGLMLAEHFSRWSAKGRIIRIRLAEVDGVFEVLREGTVLEEDEHLSFPGMFELDGTVWCLPERSRCGGLVAYRFDENLTRVLERRTVIDEVRAVDPVVFAHGGLWWLMYSPAGERSLSELHVWYAPNPFGPWHAHSANPVVADPRRARMAGTPIRIGGRLVRLGQDCSQKYGGGVRFLEVQQLDAACYSEVEIGKIIAPVDGHSKTGMHTLALVDDKVIVDGCNDTISVFAWVPRLLLALRRAQQTS